MTTTSQRRHPAVVVGEPPTDGVLAAPEREPTRILELALGLLLLYSVVPPGLPSFASAGQLALVAALALAATRRPQRDLTRSGVAWLGWALVLLLGYLVLTTLTTPDTSISGWPRRALRLAMVGMLLLVLISGRLHYPALVRGAALGAAVNYVLFTAGLAPAPYGAYLSGFYLDKNQAGLAYVVVGLLFLGLQRTRRSQVLVVLATTWTVWETGSRTSLAALACALAWLVLRPRLGLPGRLVLAGVLATGVQVLESRFAQVGAFASRFGSDVLRERIDAASRLVLDAAPVQGSGLGEAYVVIDDREFFFHNSYWTALVEGGWVLAAAYVALTAVLGIGLLRREPAPTAWRAGEAANVAVLVCALRLGEVFGTTAAVLALAAGVLGTLAVRPHGDRPPGPGRSPASLPK